MPPHRRVVVGHRTGHDRVGDERPQARHVGRLARAEPRDHAREAAQEGGERGWGGLVDEERLEPQPVEGARRVDAL